MTEYFYNDTLPAFGETRIIVEKLSLDFIGHPPFVFKPGMPFDAQIAVRYHDQVRINSNLKKRHIKIHYVASVPIFNIIPTFLGITYKRAVGRVDLDYKKLCKNGKWADY